MAYFRDYSPVFSQTKEEYIQDMQHELKTQGYAKREFAPEQSYNMRGKKKVKTKHICIFYNDKLQDRELGYMIRYYTSQWYAYQEASKETKSLPEVSHIHFLLEIDNKDNTFTYPV